MKERKAGWAEFVSKQGAWIILAFVLLLVLVVRVRLREMPLERDEGEYAYAGQLMLQGVAPYKLAYNMKLPGTYAAYAIIMALFGQSDSGIHLGLTLVNIATIVMIYFLGRRLLDTTTGAIGALAYGLLSTSSAFLGLAGHATHFVVLCALGGALLLLRAYEKEKSLLFFGSGVLFGLAFLMKQHGVFFGAFGLGYVIWRNVAGGKFRSVRLVGEFCLMFAGIALPFALVCAWLGAAGVFKPFWFWTFTYAREYAGAVGINQLHEVLTVALRVSVGVNAIFWILAAVGAVMMWWEKRLRAELPFVAGFLIAGVLALCSGMYFREHYFILLLPVVALLNGVVVSRALFLIRNEKSVELFLALTGLVLFGLAVLVAIVSHGEEWFSASPAKNSGSIYGTSIFNETRRIAAELREQSSEGARVVVLGSEPQIYFYSRRRSATGYIYTYALMEAHPYAKTMQEQMIAEIEKSPPEFAVFVQDPFSWLQGERSDTTILKWWERYWGEHYELLKTTTIAVDASRIESVPGEKAAARNSGLIMVLKRKTPPAITPSP